MNLPIITVVAGPGGTGKTTWICQKIQDLMSGGENQGESILYFSPGTGTVPIDKTRMGADLPLVKVFAEGEEADFVDYVATAKVIYIELGFHLELSAINQIVGDFPYQAIAVLPPNLEESEWHSWAREIVTGGDIIINPTNPTLSLWRAAATGQVVEEDSLQEFWYELTEGAYGKVSRAKAIFDIADGRSVYLDFVAGIEKEDFIELDLPHCLQGRPERFSGIEVYGENLDKTTIGQTLRDCCLSDSALAASQQQVKEMLLAEADV
jgi:hypothetical protein